MFDYLISFLIAFAVSFLMVPVVRSFALRFNLVDIRDDRKVHNKVVTRFGGVAIYLGFIIGMGASFFMPSGLGFTDLAPLARLITGITIIFLLGIYDDTKGANAVIKLSVQVLAAVFMVSGSFLISRINVPLFGVVEMGHLSGPITVLWIVGITNAINLIDGLDGLAGGVVAISAIGLSLSFIVTGIYSLPVFVLITLAGSTAAFLRYNFYPAKIFMGDTGSMFIGFTIATVAIMSQHKTTASIALLVPIVALGIPIFDIVAAFVRRLSRKKNPFKADKQHLHHWLLTKNLSTPQVVWILLSATVVLNVLGIGSLFLR